MVSGGFEVIRNGQGFSTRTPKETDIITRRIGGGGSSGGGMTTLVNPTPSAGDLYGSSAQKEAQIAAFRSGGQAAFEATRQVAQRQAEIQRQAEATRQANINKQAETQRQKNIAIGSASQTSRWEMQNGRSVQTTSPTLTKNIGESQASFKERARVLGKGVSQSQPKATKKFLEAREQKKAEVKIQQQSTQPIQTTRDQTFLEKATQRLFFETPGVSSLTGVISGEGKLKEGEKIYFKDKFEDKKDKGNLSWLQQKNIQLTNALTPSLETQAEIKKSDVGKFLSPGSTSVPVLNVLDKIITPAFTKLYPEKLSVPIFGGGKINIPTGKGYLLTPASPTTTSFVIGAGDVAIKSLIFAPAFQSGTASKQEVVVKSGREVLKDYIKQQQAKDIVGKFEDIFKIKGRVGVEKELIKLVKSGKVPVENLKGLTGELITRGLVRPPSGSVQPSFNIIQPKITTTPTGEFTLNIESFPAPRIENVEQLFTALKIKDIGGGTPNIKDSSQSNLPDTLQLPTIMSLTRQPQKQKQKPKQLVLQKQSPKLKQPQTQKQPQLSLQIPKQLQLQKQKTRQKQSQTFTFPKPTRTKPKLKQKEFRFAFPTFKGGRFPKQPSAKFKVLGRRFGKFKVIGTARTEKGAFQIGRKFAGSTLGVSFKIPKSKTLKLPGFRTKKEDGGIVFIEPRKRRLKKGGREVLEIQQFKGMKGGKLF